MIDGSLIVGQVGNQPITLDCAMTMLCVQYVKGKMSLDEFSEVYEALLCKAGGIDPADLPPLGSPYAG